MKAKRLLAVLLSIVMTLSVLPAAAFATDRSAAAEEPMRVFHLDCGRKYFTAEQIKSLIDEMAQDGYNYMELAVGNDGLRFLLDDLSLEYSVKTAVAEEVLPDDLLTTLDPEVVPPEETETPKPEETETPQPEETETPQPEETETPVEKVDPPVTEEAPPATEQKPPVTEAETPVTEEDSSSAEAETTAEEGILTGELTLAAREENGMGSITTYNITRSFDHGAVKAAIKAGNEAYTSASSGELTQADMDDIFAYAKKNGISIIPLVNSPGHMDAILTAAKKLTDASGLAYKYSKTTIDVTNAEAVAFTKALLQKYIDYFAGKGCKYFNMGADEYANDRFTSGGMGFGHLESSGQYKDFINYINAVAKMITTARMTPIAFNDGIRYNGQEPVTIDRNIIVSYWSSGWPGYAVASAADLANAGFQILNTNGDWYYVLKTKAASIDTVKKQIKETPWTSVMGSAVEQSKLVGAMVCLWCDDPGFAYNEGNAKEQIKVFAESNSNLFTVKPVVKDLPFTVEAADGTGSEPLTKAGLDITRGKAKTLTYTGEGTIEAKAADDTDVFSVDVSGNSRTC